jgi:ABC-type multidrug transport system fused ATPase/permease subunit
MFRLKEFRETTPALMATAAVPSSQAGAGIVVRDLRYAYQPGHDVLRGIDLTIRQGEWLAVVGPSGAERRGKVALVTQEHHVFRGTLHDNLAIARPDAADDEIAVALTTVDAWSRADHRTRHPYRAAQPGRRVRGAMARLARRSRSRSLTPGPRAVRGHQAAPAEV